MLKRIERSVPPSIPYTVTVRFTHVYPDGPAPYYTVICRTDKIKDITHLSMADIWMKIKNDVMDGIDETNGTITHHHSVGRLHMPVYLKEVGGYVEILRAVKKVCDPNGIMNPGVLVPQPKL
jgi:alkyldihydroxyacetonephosphate synthase